VGSARSALAIDVEGHLFVGPDNGVFTPVLRHTEVKAVALRIPESASPTFHGRDVFAPAAAALAAGTPLTSLGEPHQGIPQRLAYTPPYHEGKTLIGEIIYIDRFGSLVTNLTRELLSDHATLEVEDLNLGPLRRTFSDVSTGALVAYVGSGGAIEIAVRNGSAARRLGVGVGARVRVRLR
jgi:S-adenosylmethionine hydrolase